ncbi:aminotransferase class V-fold PLP-dependent enzyme [Paenarthrobacter sp. RAF54_2]|uniref:aminotransferase class V-fold PLP-dependent enzyme n=1 Tax=Paenarthrobacter sp. RAF54_2 TaxID=3233061 RepID=UPI003F983A61
MTVITPEAFRSQFPGLASTIHLASCSQGALSRDLSGELLEFQSSIMEHGAPWGPWMNKVEQARTMFAEFIGASRDEIAVVPSASEGAYQVASTQTYSARDAIVTTDLEFPSIGHVWLAQVARGARTLHVPDRAGLAFAEDYAAVIDDRTKLVSVPMITYRNGSRLPVEEVIAIAKSHGAKTFVDAYQGAGVEPINVRELDCDYLVSGTLKYMLGIAGVAFLYVRGGLSDDSDPQLTGWFGRRDPFEFDPRALGFPRAARRFESGTPAIPSVYGAVAGMRMLRQLDPQAVKQHIGRLTQQLQDELTIAGAVLDSPSNPSLRGPQVALVDENPQELSDFLKARGIVTSPRGAIVRMSFHFYNVEEDVMAVLKALGEWRGK